MNDYKCITFLVNNQVQILFSRDEFLVVAELKKVGSFPNKETAKCLVLLSFGSKEHSFNHKTHVNKMTTAKNLIGETQLFHATQFFGLNLVCSFNSLQLMYPDDCSSISSFS